MVFTFLENALNLGICIHALPPHSKLSTNSYHQTFARVGTGKLLICLAAFFENLLPPTAERGGEKYDLIYQNSIRKYEVDLEH